MGLRDAERIACSTMPTRANASAQELAASSVSVKSTAAGWLSTVVRASAEVVEPRGRIRIKTPFRA